MVLKLVKYSLIFFFFFQFHPRPSQMDPDWFSFSTCGTLIMSWAGTSHRDSPEQTMGFSGSVMEIPPYASPAVTTTQTARTQRASQALTHADVGR